MNIVLWGTYDTSKPRIRILCDGLRAHGVNITEIHASIWEDVEDKSALRGVGKWLYRGLRLLVAYPSLIWRYLRAPAHDLVLVSYPGQFDVLVIRPFAWMRCKSVVFDWFISAFDTMVDDRELLGRGNPLAWMLWTGEWLSVRAANLAFMDTATHARRMERLFRLPPHFLECVWVGAETPFFRTATRQIEYESDSTNVLFYGQFIPLHGIDTILEAACLLRDAPVRWTLIGRGQETSRIRALLAEKSLPKLRWLDWVPYCDLVEWIGRADICLGIFGTSDKAASVIPNKVFQIVAAGRPLITRDSPAARELLVENPPCVQLVEAGDAHDLARAILEYVKIVHTRISIDCHTEPRNHIDSTAIGCQFLTAITRCFPNLNSFS